eukprot:4453879-Amphidinium_carterae.1
MQACVSFPLQDGPSSRKRTPSVIGQRRLVHVGLRREEIHIHQLQPAQHSKMIIRQDSLYIVKRAMSIEHTLLLEQVFSGGNQRLQSLRD